MKFYRSFFNLCNGLVKSALILFSLNLPGWQINSGSVFTRTIEL